MRIRVSTGKFWVKTGLISPILNIPQNIVLIVMEPNLLENSIEEIVNSVFAETDGDLLVVDPSARTIESIVQSGIDAADLPNLQMLARESVLKEAMNDFLIASRAADLINTDDLTLRILTDGADNSLLASDTTVTALVGAGDAVAAMTSEDDEFVSTVYEEYSETFRAAELYNLRTPAISQVRNTLSDDIGSDTREDFDSVMASMETARGNGQGLDEVTVSLLVAARNEQLLYDISKWGEDIGIASKATFSRTKTRLEDVDLIDTEKVPIDVGRPRLRLKLGDERLTNASTDDLAGVTSSILA